MNRVEIKVGRPPSRRQIIGRVLNRGKVVNFHRVWHNQNSGRVLAGSPLDPGCPLSQAVDFGGIKDLLGIAFVGLNVTIGRLIGHGANRSGPVNVVFTKQDLGVVMGDRLVVPGEVQIDIGHLISLKAQEGFKGDILPIFN